MIVAVTKRLNLLIISEKREHIFICCSAFDIPGMICGKLTPHNSIIQKALFHFHFEFYPVIMSPNDQIIRIDYSYMY